MLSTSTDRMSFAAELALVLPADLPHREVVIAKASRHLELIVEANQHLNLTRITTPREAAIKHVLDCVLPWQLFRDARRVLDAGAGAGFPGVPLALLLPGTRFILAESIQKKARFLEEAVDSLDLANVQVEAQRAEDVLKRQRIDLITARALAPLARTLDLFGPSLKAGVRVLLFKGPDVESEIAAASPQARSYKVRICVIARYELPGSLGSRTIVEMAKA